MTKTIIMGHENNCKTITTLNEYQTAALSTAYGIPSDIDVLYSALGMCGEAGEVADKVKKVIRDDNRQFSDEKRREIAKEIGDVLWYCGVLSHYLGYSLDEIAQMNIDKLKSRIERGKLGGNGDNR